jgi:hypothetical protein
MAATETDPAIKALFSTLSGSLPLGAPHAVALVMALENSRRSLAEARRGTVCECFPVVNGRRRRPTVLWFDSARRSWSRVEMVSGGVWS